MVETDKDRLLFLQDFGVTVDAGSLSVKGIFDNEFVEVDAGGGVPMVISQPRLLIRSSDSGHIAEDQIIIIPVDGVKTSYRVRVKHQDGVGMTVLLLERQ